jgi:hypothetical protein
MLILFSSIWHLFVKKKIFLPTYLSEYPNFNNSETFDIF